MRKLVTIVTVIALLWFAIPLSVLGQEDLIFKDGFESGDLSAWDYVSGGGPLFAASQDAEIIGDWGLINTYSEYNPPRYVEDQSPNSESHYRVRFYFDPNGMTIPNTNGQYIFWGFNTTTYNLMVLFRVVDGVYQIIPSTRDDATTRSMSYYAISDEPHCIELEFMAASAPGANDGYFSFWLDGELKQTLASLDNDMQRIEKIQLGSISGVTNGTTGSYYFDAFESRRSSYIGPEPEPEPTPTPDVTPTPAHVAKVNLSSGSVLNIERSISYGDIAEIMAIMLVIILYSVSVVIRVMDK